MVPRNNNTMQCMSDMQNGSTLRNALSSSPTHLQSKLTKNESKSVSWLTTPSGNIDTVGSSDLAIGNPYISDHKHYAQQYLA